MGGALPRNPGTTAQGTQVYDITAERHVFWVEAIDPRGNLFAVALESWTAS